MANLTYVLHPQLPEDDIVDAAVDILPSVDVIVPEANQTLQVSRVPEATI